MRARRRRLDQLAPGGSGGAAPGRAKTRSTRGAAASLSLSLKKLSVLSANIETDQ